MISRRAFLARSAAGCALAVGAGAFGEALDGTLMGAQSYSVREFDFERSIQALKALGLNRMEFCTAHFPADKGDAGFEKVKNTIQEQGIEVPCFGVQSFSADEAANRKNFEFAQALGVGILTANPTKDAFDSLESLTEEFGIKIAIHNHGPGARYDGVADTLEAVKGRHPRIGACVDTGHVLRSGEHPHEVIDALGDRVHSLHLKDWKFGGEEQVLGEGDMDLTAVAKSLKALNFVGPIMMEYENHPGDPVPHMKKGLENWRAAVRSV